MATGYLLGVLTAAVIAESMASGDPSIFRLACVFIGSGVYISVQDTLEGAIPADLVPPRSRGTAYGVLGTVNGIGDLVSSAFVGTLWTAASPAVAFDCAGAVMLAGTLLLIKNWRPSLEHKV